MYNPCFECWNRYGKQYTEECDDNCEYAYQYKLLSKLEPYGGIDEAVRVMKGDAIPVGLLKRENIDWTYTIVSAIRDELNQEK